jgi:predicted nucleic acid-binding protein
MVIVDTTVWIDYFRKIENAETNWLETELQKRRLGLTDLILCEVLQGIRDPGGFEELREQLLKFQVFSTGGTDLAIAAAKNYRALRERGHTVRKTIDCLIATFCLRSDHSLLHRDRDFDAFETAFGLKVVHA